MIDLRKLIAHRNSVKSRPLKKSELLHYYLSLFAKKGVKLEMNLTIQQEQAILSLKKIQKDRLFTGISPGIIEKDFLDINEKLLTADKEFTKKLRDSELALFVLCGYTPNT